MWVCTGIPLTYFIRINIEVKPEAGDPSFGSTDNPYESINKEMVARAPIITLNLGSRISNELKVSGPFKAPSNLT